MKYIEIIWHYESTHKGELPERVHATAKAICEKYDLLYYKGKGYKVTKVRTGL